MDEAVDQLQAEYDAVPYESHAFPQSAPGQSGRDRPSIRVGDARGVQRPRIGNRLFRRGNLIPFAARHPQARVVGIDLSQVQVDQGRERIQALGLDNLELLQGDIARTDLSALGRFDFIISHSVYSWVPENVQHAILAPFRSLMALDGVAYIGYNTYPGWKAKEIVRDAMLLRGGAMGTPGEKLSHARGMIDFLEEVAPADSVLAKASDEADVRDARAAYVDSAPQRLAQPKLARVSDGGI